MIGKFRSIFTEQPLAHKKSQALQIVYPKFLFVYDADCPHARNRNNVKDITLTSTC